MPLTSIYEDDGDGDGDDYDDSDKDDVEEEEEEEMTILSDRFVGLMVKASASRAEDPEFDSRLRLGDFSGSCHTSDLKVGSPVATLPGAWRYRVSAGTGWPGVSIL